jgi:formylglycine-generating enzyme required for sulfatase activity
MNKFRFLLAMLLFAVVSCGNDNPAEEITPPDETTPGAGTPGGFVHVPGGTFTMGSPDNEAEREADEIRHTVTVSGFYIASSELTQAQYRAVTGENPSANQGDNLPVENVTWYDAVQYCNALSQRDGLTPAYTISGQTVTWNRSANGYRLPTEAEWEFACRAGIATPFNFGGYVEDSDANCYNAYGYNNNASGSWVNGYLQHSVAVNSYSPNGLELYDMHGNVAEWVWDWYGAYGTASASDPAGTSEGNYKTARGGGWNDFPKHIRSAYRSAFPADVPLYGIGIRLARNAETGADIFRLERETPYSSTYSEALNELRQTARPNLKAYLEDAGLDINDYDIILLGYCNWWASIPATVRTFLTRYDLSGKTIIPFCSQGGGRFGQTISAIAKLAPNSTVKEGLYVTYSSYDRARISEWLGSHNIQTK